MVSRRRIERRAAALLVGLALVLLAPAAARAQGNHGLFSRDGLDVWAVGDSGRYYRSLDGGASWMVGNLGARPLRGVAARGFRVFVVGDSGRIWKSPDSGGSWSLTTIAGAPVLRAVDFPDDSVGYVAGDGGTLLKLTASGDSVQALPSGTGVRINAVRFRDSLNGWVVGAGGFAARTGNGGASWTPVGLGTVNELRGVDEAGGTVWIVGDHGTALRSPDGGVSFDPVNLKLDARSDVRAVRLAGADTVWLAGGGGFLRQSVDGGESWAFPQHALHGQVSALAFAGGRGYACSHRHRAVFRSADGGLAWALPQGATLTRSWSQRLFLGANVLQVRGQTFALNPVHDREIYVMLGFYAGYIRLYQSRDEGETWTQVGNTISSHPKANAFVISPRDSNLMVAAVADPGALLRSTDGFQSWTATLGDPFGEYSIPIEMHPDRPDTLLFGGDSTWLKRSTDFGSTWSTYSSTLIREPDDLLIVPDSSEIVIVGDGVTGIGYEQILRSTDGGVTFTPQQTGTGSASEVPGLACSRLRNAMVFATSWSSGGLWRSHNYGNTWGPATSTNSAWGVDIARDDPNLVIFGVFNGGQSWLSLDGGYNFTGVPLSGANYTFFARDRGLILAQQSNGVWKMVFSYAFTPDNTQAVTLTAPNGGQVWNPGQVNPITWNPTRVALARLEYRIAPGEPWQWIADVDGHLGRWDWTVPANPTATAKVRVSDAWDGAPSDTSASGFTITTGVGVAHVPAAAFALEPPRPNPFAGVTTLRYRLAVRGPVRLEVFDVRGERVAVLVDGVEEAGSHSVAFGSGVAAGGRRIRGLPSGVYFARLRAGAFTATRKLLLMR